MERAYQLVHMRMHLPFDHDLPSAVRFYSVQPDALNLIAAQLPGGFSAKQVHKLCWLMWHGMAFSVLHGLALGTTPEGPASLDVSPGP